MEEDLFFAHCAYLSGILGEHWKDNSRRAFFTWMCAYLKDANFLQACFQMNSNVQLDAEDALCLLLEKNCESSYRHKIKNSSKIERDVDWAGTFADSIPLHPYQYKIKEKRVCLDIETISALCSLGDSWAAIRLGINKKDENAAKLLKVIKKNRMRCDYYIPFKHYYAKRLYPYYPNEIEKIQQGLNFWNQPLKKEDLEKLLNGFAEKSKIKAKNSDTLLEFLMHVSVVRAATAGDWKIEGIELKNNLQQNKAGKPPSIVLNHKNANIACKVFKGRPAEEEAKDRINLLREAAGGKPTGNQPDLTIKFYQRDNENNYIYVLGDAKRNDSGDGKGYIASSFEIACVYMVSYGHLMGVEIKKEIECAIYPAVTLFCYQGVDKVANRTAENDILAYFETMGDKEKYAVMAFDLRHLKLQDKRTPILEAWFKSIAKQVEAGKWSNGIAVSTTPATLSTL